MSCSSFLRSWVWVLIYWGQLFACLLIFCLNWTHSLFWWMTCKQWCYMLVHLGGLCTWVRISCWLYIVTNRGICWTVLACAGSRRECLRDSSFIVNEHKGIGKGNWGPTGVCVVKIIVITLSQLDFDLWGFVSFDTRGGVKRSWDLFQIKSLIKFSSISQKYSFQSGGPAWTKIIQRFSMSER